MKKKIIAGLMVAFAVIAPVSSANAATPTSGTISIATPYTYLVVNDSSSFAVGDSFIIKTMDASGTENSASVTIDQIINPVMVALNGTVPPAFHQATVTITYPTVQFTPMSLFDNVKEFLAGKLLPAVAGLVVLGISVRLAIKAVRKFANVA